MPTDDKERMGKSQELKDILDAEKEQKTREDEKDFKKKSQASIDLVNSTSAQANKEESKMDETKSSESTTSVELKDVLKEGEQQSKSNGGFVQKAQASIDLMNSTSVAADNLNKLDEKHEEQQPTADEEDKRRKGHYALETFSKSMVVEAKNQLKEAYDEVSARLHGPSSSSSTEQHQQEQDESSKPSSTEQAHTSIRMSEGGSSPSLSSSQCDLKQERVGLDEEIEEEAKVITPETRNAGADEMDRSMTRMERESLDEETETEAAELKLTNGKKKKIVHAPFSKEFSTESSSSEQQQENSTLRQEATQMMRDESNKIDGGGDRQKQRERMTTRSDQQQIGMDEEVEQETKTIDPETRVAAADNMDRAMTKMERQSVDEETEESELKPSNGVHATSSSRENPTLRQEATQMRDDRRESERERMTVQQADQPKQRQEVAGTRNGQIGMDEEFERETKTITPDTRIAAADNMDRSKTRVERQSVDEAMEASEMKPSDTVNTTTNNNNNVSIPEQASPDALNVTNAPISAESASMVSGEQFKENPILKSEATQTPMSEEDQRNQEVYDHFRFSSTAPSSHYHDEPIRQKDVKGTEFRKEEMASSVIQASDASQQQPQPEESTPTTVESTNSKAQDAVNFVAKAAAITAKQGTDALTSTVDNLISGDSSSSPTTDDNKSTTIQSFEQSVSSMAEEFKGRLAHTIESAKQTVESLQSQATETIKQGVQQMTGETKREVSNTAAAGENASKLPQPSMTEKMNDAWDASKQLVSNNIEAGKRIVNELVEPTPSEQQTPKDNSFLHKASTVIETVASAGEVAQQATSMVVQEALDAVEGAVYSAPHAVSEAAHKLKESIKEEASIAKGMLKDVKEAVLGQGEEGQHSMNALENARPRIKSLITSPYSTEKASQLASEALESAKSMTNQATLGASAAVGKAIEYVPPREKIEEVANQSVDTAKSASMGAAAAVGKAMEYVPPREKVEEIANQSLDATKSAVNKAMEYVPQREDVENAAKSASLGAAAAVGKAMEYVPPREDVESAAQSASLGAAAAVGKAMEYVPPREKVEEAANQSLQTAKSAVDSATNTASNVARTVESTASAGLNKIESVGSSAAQAAGSTATSVVEGVKSAAHGVQSAASFAIEGMESAASSAAQGVRSVTHGVQSTASSAVEGVESAASSAVEGVESTVASAAQKVGSTASSVAQKVGSTIQSVESTAASAAQGVESAASSVVQNVESAASSAVQGVESTASSVVQNVESAASSAGHGVESSVKALATSPQKVINEIRGGTEVVGKVTRELGRPYVETMSKAVQKLTSDSNADPQSTRAVHASLMDGLGKLAFEEFNNASPEGDFQSSSSIEQPQQRPPVNNNSVPVGQAFANEVLESVKDHGDGDFDAGIRPKKLTGLDSPRSGEVGEEELARIQVEMDDGESALPIAEHGGDKTHVNEPRGLVDSIKYKVKTTWGIVNEQLPIEFVYQLKAEEEEEKQHQQHDHYEDQRRKSTNKDTSHEGTKETSIGQDLIDTIDKAQQRISRAFGMSRPRSSGSSGSGTNRPSSPLPPSRNDSSQGIASSAVGSAYHLSTKLDYVASSLSSATYVGNDQQPSQPLGSEDGLPDFPTDDITEEFMAMSVSHKRVSSSGKPTAVHSFGSSLPGRKLMSEWPESIESPSSSETATSLGFSKWPESVESPSSEQRGVLNRLKTRAKRLFGLKDEEMDGHENQHFVDNSPESIERELEPQGNEVGGLAKEMILGHKDALRPGDGVAKSGQEMDEISHHIAEVRRQIYGERKEDCETGVVPQIDDIPGGVPFKSVEAKKKKMGVEEKKGWLTRMLSRAKL